MNFKQALDYMKSGGKVRRPTFSKDNYWYLKSDILMCGKTQEKAYMNIKLLEANDWERFEEKTLSDKGTDANELLDVLIRFTEEQFKYSLTEAKLDIPFHVNQETVKQARKMIKQELSDMLIFDGRDVKEALNRFMKEVSYPNDTLLREKAREIFGDRLI